MRHSNCPPDRPRPRAKGFGLLEVIVALVLLSTTGLALFTWINQNLSDASRLRDSLLAAQLSIDALALVGDVNPVVQPSGQRQLGALEVEWTSSVVQPLQSGQSALIGVPGIWQVGLFQLKVIARDKNTATTTNFEVLQTGQQSSDASRP